MLQKVEVDVDAAQERSFKNRRMNGSYHAMSGEDASYGIGCGNVST